MTENYTTNKTGSRTAVLLCDDKPLSMANKKPDDIESGPRHVAMQV